jgi:hypothetical protein
MFSAYRFPVNAIQVSLLQDKLFTAKIENISEIASFL